MKKNFRRLGAVVLLCVMVIGTSITSSADVHTCAFSYMGNELYSSWDGGSHPYYVYEGNTMVTKSCHITYYTYRKVYKCACGNTEYRDQWTVTEHSEHCGS